MLSLKLHSSDAGSQLGACRQPSFALCFALMCIVLCGFTPIAGLLPQPGNTHTHKHTAAPSWGLGYSHYLSCYGGSQVTGVYTASSALMSRTCPLFLVLSLNSFTIFCISFLLTRQDSTAVLCRECLFFNVILKVWTVIMFWSLHSPNTSVVCFFLPTQLF